MQVKRMGLLICFLRGFCASHGTFPAGPVFEIDLPLSSGVTLAICKLIPLGVLMRLMRASFLKRTSPAEMIRSVCFQTITDEPEKDC